MPLLATKPLSFMPCRTAPASHRRWVAPPDVGLGDEVVPLR